MVATSAMLLVQGAPHITSEEMGKAVEQLKEMITSEIQAVEAKSAYYPRARQGAEAKSADLIWARQGAKANSAYPPWTRQGAEAKSAYIPYYHAQSAYFPREQNYHAQSAWHPREQNYRAQSAQFPQSAGHPRKQGYGRQVSIAANTDTIIIIIFSLSRIRSQHKLVESAFKIVVLLAILFRPLSLLSIPSSPRVNLVFS